MVVNNKTLRITMAVMLFVVAATIFIFSKTAIADVASVTTLTHSSSERFNASVYPSKNTSAIAGNVTELIIAGVSPTKAWQGYYGNVSGTITLEDALGNTFYNWSVATPSGEVYASPNSSVTWTNIECFNFTGNGSLEINQSIVEGWFNIASDDPDRLSTTFNVTDHSTFYVGSITITADTCPSTYVYDNTGYQTTNFENILLTDNSSLVFTTLLENSQTGFDSAAHDFQMLVAENGHGADTSTTPYFFWVELE